MEATVAKPHVSHRKIAYLDSFVSDQLVSDLTVICFTLFTLKRERISKKISKKVNKQASLHKYEQSIKIFAISS